MFAGRRKKKIRAAHSTRIRSAFDPHPYPMTSPLDRIRVVLCATSHPGNIGASARAMQTMGLSRLVLVNPQRYPDADADAMAAGASTILQSSLFTSSLD